jgi:uncharacterized membrane protein YcaP (DUF421 family)
MMTVVRALVMYFLLLLMLRITTRRVMRAATPIDMAVIFLFGGLAVQPVLGDDHSITAAALAIFAVAAAHIAISRLKVPMPLIGMITNGTPVLIYSNERWDVSKMRAMSVQEEDVLAEARQNGLHSMSEVDCVIIEHNGGITVMPKAS